MRPKRRTPSATRRRRRNSSTRSPRISSASSPSGRNIRRTGGPTSTWCAIPRPGPRHRPTASRSRIRWCSTGRRLFNTRYRMLLTFLSHSYRLSRLSRPGEPNLRGMVMHRAFGEMYHIKSISGLMVQMKVGHDGEDGSLRGPALRDALFARHAGKRCRLLAAAPRPHHRRARGDRATCARPASRWAAPICRSLYELDLQAEAWIDGILRAAEPGMRA